MSQCSPLVRSFVDRGSWLAVASLMLSLVVIAAEDNPLARATELPEGKAQLFFEADVRPILKAHCFHCHGEEPELSGGLDLRLVRLMHAGGDSGSAIEVGLPNQSLLYQRVADQQMPPGPVKLNQDELHTILRWIESGARTLRAEPTDPNDAQFTEEELAHWAFRPPVRPPLPPALESPVSERDRSDTQGSDLGLANDGHALELQPIDRFVADKLTQQGLSFAAPADRATLLRRLKFDLLGLPPTPQELTEFMADRRAGAYERWVDRWLASPHYGVRWARHWLDVVGYAESDGNIPKDQPRPYAWYYRDYVVDSLNSDKPYDQFLLEQLAGDELIDGPADGNNLRHVELMAATGLLRMAPDLTQTDNTLMDRNQAVAEVLNVVGTGVLGLTVGCAQCHDHRYDPISIRDYYALRAVFDPVFPLQEWKRPTDRLLDLTDAPTQAQAAEIEKQAAAMQDAISQRRRDHCQTIQAREITKVPEDLREAIRTAVNTKPSEQTTEQKQLLDRYPTVRTIDWIVGQLVEYDRKAYDNFVAEEKKVAEVRATKPLQRLIMCVGEDRHKVPVSIVFFRGNPESPTEEVQPRELTALTASRTGVSIPSLADQLSHTTGRRFHYARQLTDGTHPTVARVMVNRVWLHHFGAGLVSTPGDFGLNGNPPTHPELLDWLAVEFMEQGWSLKQLHRQILLSRTYQQSAVPDNPLSFSLDPDNRWLGRASLRRLDAEALRDAMLQVGGRLNGTMAGPSVSVTEDGEGKAVIGTQNRRNGLFDSVSDAGSEAYRRSLFMAAWRSLPLHELKTFDLPELTPNCQVRETSTVAQQALFLMNDPFVLEAAYRMAESLAAQTQDGEAQVREAYLRLFCCEPTARQMQQAVQFIQQQKAALRDNRDDAWRKRIDEQPELVALTALANLCQSLLSSNRFLYVQ